MEDREFWNLNWTSLFLVTSISCFLFSIGIKVLDGTFPLVLLITGISAAVLTTICWLLSLVIRQSNKRKEKENVLPEPGNY